MRRSTMFGFFVTVCSGIVTLKMASGQSSHWVVLEDNSAPVESFKAAGLFDPLPNAVGLNNATCNRTKHEEFCNCHVRMCLEPKEYVIVNGEAHVEVYNRSYNSSFYELDGDCLRICAPDFLLDKSTEIIFAGKHSTTLMYITIIGLAISMLCLVLHLIAFVIVPELRNVPDYCVACLCVSLLAGYTSFLVGFHDDIMQSGGACIATAVSTHFFLLASLLWMNAMSYDVLKSLLKATGKISISSPWPSLKKFYLYCLYSWGIALLLAIAAVISDNVPSFPEEFKPHFGQGLCWFKQKKGLLVFFAVPVFVVICINAVCFVYSVYTMISNKIKTDDPHRLKLKRNLVVYVKLAVIMGVSWVSGLLAAVTDAVFLWYVFVILNTLQGLFIFLVFTCTKKVRKHFTSGKFSTRSESPSFHSYVTNGKPFETVTVVREI